MKYYNLIFGIIVGFLFIMLLKVLWVKNEKVSPPIQDIGPSELSYEFQPTLDSIYSEIMTLRLDHPNVVFAQVLLESEYLKSNLYITNKNLFGMKVSGNRATTSIKIINGYKWYPSWRESLLDYALLQMAFYKNLSEEEYFHKLSKSYASDPNYTNKLKELIK